MTPQTVAVVGNLIAFETIERCHHQLPVGARFEPFELGGECCLLCRIEQIGLIDDATGQFRKILRKGRTSGQNQQHRDQKASGLFHIIVP